MAGTHAVPEGTDKHAVKLIAELAMPQSILQGDELEDFVSTKDHTYGRRKQNESISSDPDGLTFSHCKAASEDEVLAQFDATL